MFMKGIHMNARIYRPAKTAMSSGTARTQKWVLEFLNEKPRYKDNFTGWNSADETRTQVKLYFDSLDAARNYARDHNIDARIDMPQEKKPVIKAYADNFKAGRIGSWTH